MKTKINKSKITTQNIQEDDLIKMTLEILKGEEYKETVKELGVEKEVKKVLKTEDKKKYNKDYYDIHKDKMKARMTELLPDRNRRKIVKGLNDGLYKRIPFLKMQKYNIVLNNETGKFE